MEKRPRQRVSFKRIGLCLLAIFVSLWVVEQVFGQIGAWYIAHRAAKDQVAAMEPQALQDRRLASCGETPISASGFTFCNPWPGKMKRTDAKQGFTFLHFGDSIGVTLLHGDDGVELKADPKGTLDPAVSRQLYGAEASASGFALLSAALYEVPSDVSWYQSRGRNTRAFMLLLKKRLSLHGATIIYPLASEQIRGFQIGDPARDGHVELKLFDKQDREIWMLLNGRKHDPDALTQPQINAIVASIHPAS